MYFRAVVGGLIRSKAIYLTGSAERDSSERAPTSSASAWRQIGAVLAAAIRPFVLQSRLLDRRVHDHGDGVGRRYRSCSPRGDPRSVCYF